MRFVQKGSIVSNQLIPGKIKNEYLEELLVIKDNRAKLKKNTDFYLITQEVWEFFFNIYGGGPTISINTNEELNLTLPSQAGSNKYEIQSVASSTMSNSKYGQSTTQSTNFRGENGNIEAAKNRLASTL